MEENLKLYSQRAIAIATFFGGPLAAGVLIRRNSLNLGREKDGAIALIVGIITTILLFWGIFQIPEPIIDKIPNVIIPAIYTGIIYLIVEKIQGQKLREHKEERGVFYSAWRATGIGAICAAILLGGIFAGAYSFLDDWDAEIYNIELEKFAKNEEEAMKIYTMPDYTSKHKLVDFIERTGIPKWEENIEIVNKISGLENMPEEYQKQNKLLLEYTKLRIETYELMSKAILNDTSEFEEEINQKNARIDEIIDGL